LFEFSLETTPQIFHTASNWLTLALAVQRYVYVCHPPLAKRCCTVSQTRLLVMCLVGMSVMHMVPRALDREYYIQLVG
jgi:neuromedin U receptor 1